MTETVRYNYRLRPGRAAELSLIAEWHRCRWIWNECVHQQRSGRPISSARLSKLLTEARSENSWLRNGWQNAQQVTIVAYADALLGRRRTPACRPPKLKRKGIDLPSLPFTRNGFRLRGGRLVLPKGTVIPVVWSRDLPSEPTSCRVYQDNLGHWYVSFVVRREAASAPEVDGRIGIDWGVKATATTTDPAYDLPHLGYRKRCAAELAKAQRKMARRRRLKGQPQSRGYRDAKRQAAQLQKKAARQNQHAARVWAKRVVDNHDLIAVEDFKPKFLAKSTMARKAADAAIGAAKRELIERGTRAGRKVVLIKPAYTTMTCAECGSRAKNSLTLTERTFVCQSCGVIADRDANAARVILALAEPVQAGAEDVSHSVPSFPVRERMLSEPEIPRRSAVGVAKAGLLSEQRARRPDRPARRSGVR